MKPALCMSLLLSSLAGHALAQDVEGVKQIDRVCLGRMLIVQTMATDKERGKTEQQYRSENPLDPQWQPQMKAEVSAVISYVFSHSLNDNLAFSGAVMQACYDTHTES